MWAKNGRGLKTICISLLFLVLVVGNLGAWSWNFGKEKDQPPPQPVVQADSQEATLSSMPLVQDLQKQLESLQPVLAGYVQLEADWKALLEENGLWLGDLETSIASLIISSTKVETMIPIAEVAQTVLKSDYDLLVEAKRQKDLEAQGYWGDLIVANEKIDALEGSRVGVVLGAGANWDMKTGRWGAEATAGVAIDRTTLYLGAKYVPEFWTDLPDLEHFVFSAGILRKF